MPYLECHQCCPSPNWWFLLFQVKRGPSPTETQGKAHIWQDSEEVKIKISKAFIYPKWKTLGLKRLGEPTSLADLIMSISKYGLNKTPALILQSTVQWLWWAIFHTFLSVSSVKKLSAIPMRLTIIHLIVGKKWKVIEIHIHKDTKVCVTKKPQLTQLWDIYVPDVPEI